jgi:hypothetical protein
MQAAFVREKHMCDLGLSIMAIIKNNHTLHNIEHDSNYGSHNVSFTTLVIYTYDDYTYVFAIAKLLLYTSMTGYLMSASLIPRINC